jgi:hypothetical protein
MNMTRLDFPAERFFLAIWSQAVVATVVALATIACSTSKHDTPCPRNQAAFRLQLTAVDGPLPSDVVIAVAYNGIERETYSLKKGGAQNNDVCCRPGSSVRGALPDVKCGLPPPDAAMSLPVHDAAVVRDATTLHDAAPLHDATALPKDAAIREASTTADARTTRDAEPTMTVLADAARVPAMSLDAATSPPRDASAMHDVVVDAATPAKRGGTEAILCDLWTGGGADVTVTGTGYPALATHFDPFVPEPRCGVETVDQRLVLTHGDAAIP